MKSRERCIDTMQFSRWQIPSKKRLTKRSFENDLKVARDLRYSRVEKSARRKNVIVRLKLPVVFGPCFSKINLARWLDAKLLTSDLGKSGISIFSRYCLLLIACEYTPLKRKIRKDSPPQAAWYARSGATYGNKAQAFSPVRLYPIRASLIFRGRLS